MSFTLLNQPAEGVEADAGKVVFASDLAEVNDGLGGGVHTEHRRVLLLGVVLTVGVVVVHDELVVVLPPCKDVAPMRQVVRDHREPVSVINNGRVTYHPYSFVCLFALLLLQVHCMVQFSMFAGLPLLT